MVTLLANLNARSSRLSPNHTKTLHLKGVRNPQSNGLSLFRAAAHIIHRDLTSVSNGIATRELALRVEEYQDARSEGVMIHPVGEPESVHGIEDISMDP